MGYQYGRWKTLMSCNYAYKGFTTFSQPWKIPSSATCTETKYYINFAIRYNVFWSLVSYDELFKINIKSE